jgi:hypothetical protein
MRLYRGVVCHTSKRKQLVRDEDGRVVLAAVEGFLAPFAKVLLHNSVMARAKACFRQLVYVVTSRLSPVVVAVGGTRCWLRDRACYAKAHVCGVPAAAGRLSQPESCLHRDLAAVTFTFTQPSFDTSYNTHTTRSYRTVTLHRHNHIRHLVHRHV